ncbi:MAG: tetratricopeptide repeat protein [Myxococcota bacterium]
MKGVTLIAALLGVAAFAAADAYAQTPQRGRASAEELQAQVDQIARQIETARNNIDLVEKQYTLREEQSDDAARLQRFSDGEIQYLLNDYNTAAVLFYDLVANKDFQKSPRYADALFYLSDSLYQQKNYLGARLYLKQLLSLKAGHYKEALARYLEIAGRLNEFAGIDDYINQARGLSGGALPPELTYVYAKWLFRRGDLPLEDRVKRSQAIFSSLVQDQGGPFRLQSAYFIGVGHVKLKQWDQAIAQFKAIGAMPERDPKKDKEVKELADLSLGRVYFEVGRYDEAIDSYAKVPQQSYNFPDSLYEIAWAYVRKGELVRAKNATEVLLLVAEDSVLAPEAKILQGTLLQKLQKYEEAIDTYNQVINTYAPVRDEIDALLTVNQDPVQYFDELLARNEKTLDVTRLLPPVALKWASTREEVADAVAITAALDESRKGIAESRAIADRILHSLEERGLESFPVLQEGYARADAVDTMIARAEESLTRIEGYLTGGVMSPEQQAQVRDLKAKADVLKKRLDTVPTTPEQLQARRARIQKVIDELDQQAFRLGIEIQSQAAQLVAIRKYVDDTKSQRKDTPDDEKAFLEKVTLEQRSLEAMQSELDELRAQLLSERNNADKAVSGEGALRDEYAKLLEQIQAVYAASRGGLPSNAQQVLLRADVVRADAQAVRERVARSKSIIRERVSRKAQKLREQVLLEQKLIDDYTKETEAVTGETRNLVGRIAFDSFKRVRQSFYDLVLKADVGVVDVAFQRKQDKTSNIQKLAGQKDRELKQLDEEFKEVLQDVD